MNNQNINNNANNGSNVEIVNNDDEEGSKQSRRVEPMPGSRINGSNG